MKNILTVIFFFASLLVHAQKELSTSVPAAIRAYDEAQNLLDQNKIEGAIEQLDRAIKADPKFVEAYLLKGQVLSEMRKSPEAIAAYKEAIAVNPDFFPNKYFFLGIEQYRSGLYEEAKINFEKFITYRDTRGSMQFQAKQMIKNSEFAAEAVRNPVPYDPKNMGENINTSHEEYFPTITADGKTFIFTRRIITRNENGIVSQQEDFYRSVYEAAGWSKAVPITELNTPGNEGASALSADGQYLFMIACNDLREIEGARKTLGSCDIFISKKKGISFTEPRNLQVPINSSLKESMPSFSSDGRTLYFVRRSKGADKMDQYDIMMSSIGDNSEWSEPASLSDLINTSGDETSVFIHPDDQTLYFCSNGHPGLGGFDVFMCRRDSSGNWQKPVNIGYPINTIHDEASFLVSPDGKTGFVSSRRKEGFGGEDIYQFDLYEKARPVPVSYMKGKVYDSETKKPLAVTFELIDLATGKVVVSSTSNEQTGDYLVSLPTGKRYALNVSKDGYLFYSENFELKDSKTSEPFTKDVPMKPIKAGESMVLKNIFFNTDKFDLKEESKVELNRLVTFLNKNPKINFEISGHTDNVGAKTYNQTLSEKRARSVYDYLISKNIPAARMISKGYGDTKPVAENTTDKGRAQNRRTEFVVTSMN